MPRYIVYNKKNGNVVHLHETYSAASGVSRRVDREDVLELVDESWPREDLEIIEVENESMQAQGMIRVDPETKKLVEESRESR